MSNDDGDDNDQDDDCDCRMCKTDYRIANPAQRQVTADRNVTTWCQAPGGKNNRFDTLIDNLERDV